MLTDRFLQSYCCQKAREYIIHYILYNLCCPLSIFRDFLIGTLLRVILYDELNYLLLWWLVCHSQDFISYNNNKNANILVVVPCWNGHWLKELKATKNMIHSDLKCDSFIAWLIYSDRAGTIFAHHPSRKGRSLLRICNSRKSSGHTWRLAIL